MIILVIIIMMITADDNGPALWTFFDSSKTAIMVSDPAGGSQLLVPCVLQRRQNLSKGKFPGPSSPANCLLRFRVSAADSAWEHDKVPNPETMNKSNKVTLFNVSDISN
jgi:hypothetical protein